MHWRIIFFNVLTQISNVKDRRNLVAAFPQVFASTTDWNRLLTEITKSKVDDFPNWFASNFYRFGDDMLRNYENALYAREVTGEIPDDTPPESYTLQIETLMHSGIGGLRAFDCVQIDGDVQALPDVFHNFEACEYADIDTNLDIIPPSFGELASLTSLEITAREFCELPDCIRKLTKLDHIHIGNAKIPEWLSELTELGFL